MKHYKISSMDKELETKYCSLSMWTGAA